ncbi:MAG: 2-amino-4-deoxychorismate dehydrogenase [Betaproteobacteria bacterium ADurb.Bin341]|nr:MAG: 2-amino-4-deoxychorismate dehydrogenase [Betaproteobacteria bacterium ADurb.Bin341]
MKVIGVCGSPRIGGNTEYAVQYTLDRLAEQGIETELIRLREKNVTYCTACYQCVQMKKCTINDDLEGIFQKIEAADGLIMASPVYHASVTPLIKCLMDRLGFSGRWRENAMQAVDTAYTFKGTPFSGKVGAAITVARRAGTTSAFSDLLLWFTVNDFIVVGSGYWTMLLAGKGGAVNASEDTEGLANLDHLADNMAGLIKKLKQ